MVLKSLIIISILSIINSCKYNIEHQYPTQKNYYQKKSIGKFFDRDLVFRKKHNQQKLTLSRHDFWQQQKNKILAAGFEIDFSDDELFFITTKWKNHDQNHQIKINILFKNNYKNHSKNLSITVATRIKNPQQEWVLSDKKKLKNLYLNKIIKN